MGTIVWVESIALPYAATIEEINGYECHLAQAAGIDGHEYLRLSIDSGYSPLSFANGKSQYRLTRVKLWAVSPFTYHKKARYISAPKDKDFVVSIASLKKKIAELEAWYQSELELKAQKDQKAKEQKIFVEQCRAIGLPMTLEDYIRSDHYFQVAASGSEDLSITIARRLNQEQAIELNAFLQELFKENDGEQ